MLNIIDSNNLSFTPMNYYLTFAGSDSESELEFAVRVNHSQAGRLADALLLAQATHRHIDFAWFLPVEISRKEDAGDGVNSLSETLSSKLCWLSMANEEVTLFVAGYNHAVRIPYMLFHSKVSELYEQMKGRPVKWLHTMVNDQPKLGKILVEQLDNRAVVIKDDLLLVGSYTNNGCRLRNNDIMTFQRDVDGLWLYVEPTSAARYAEFVTNTQKLAVTY